MDNIVRYYWLVYWDESSCQDIEEILTAYYSPVALQDATDRYNAICSPYKKLVACYQDRDVDLFVYSDPVYWSMNE